ncbi:MAG: Gfo/Idh/MocA family oxidoreductase [Planctomycetales bacterium]|nr:Gfo/Idh/MocA family oxidoreductase [Planctomycetales bacterium]
MNLTPEQREIGKQNFYEAMGTTRRDFLKGSALSAAVAGTGLGAAYFNYGATVDRPVRVGIIGTGDEGNVLIGGVNPDYVEVVAIADIRPYNIHRAFHGHQAALGPRPGLMKVYGWSTEDEARKHVKVYNDMYDELIADENVEAVIIALPLWLHDVAAIKAMRAGKHVLTEKLMGQTIGRCKEMARAAAQLRDPDGNPIHLATGHQRHYSILYDNAVDQIKRGLIGDIHHIRAQWHRSNLPGHDSWQPSMPTEVVEKRVVDIARRDAKASGGPAAEEAVIEQWKILLDLWNREGRIAKETDPATAEKLEAQAAEFRAQLQDLAVDAAKYGYQEKTIDGGYTYKPLEELIRWRLWDRTGAGLMAELGSHQLDAAGIFVSSQRDDGEKVHPLAVQGIGVRSLFPADREVDDHVHCQFEYPMKGYYEDFKTQQVADPNRQLVVTYSSINGNGFGNYGEVVLGTKGTMVVASEKEVLLYKGGDANAKIEVKEGKGGAAMTSYETGGGAAPIAQASVPQNVSRGYREEIEHWAWCIRNPAPENHPKCTPKVAMADAVIALTSNLAMQRKQRIEFKKEWFDIDSDETPEDSAPRSLADLA